MAALLPTTLSSRHDHWLALLQDSGLCTYCQGSGGATSACSGLAAALPHKILETSSSEKPTAYWNLDKSLVPQ